MLAATGLARVSVYRFHDRRPLDESRDLHWSVLVCPGRTLARGGSFLVRRVRSLCSDLNVADVESIDVGEVSGSLTAYNITVITREHRIWLDVSGAVCRCLRDSLADTADQPA